MEEKTGTTKFSKKKKIKFFFITLLFLLIVVIIISEILLYLFHYESSYDKLKGFELKKAKWWQCDSVTGPRYAANEITKADSIFFKSINETWYYNRLKMVNKDGYHDKDEFNNISPDNDSLKILFAGDSFTWGASADVDSSYVDVFERDIKKNYPAVVWNTGIPATGTNHALFTTKKYLPLQKSNYVILGFYVGNDFADNLLPFDDLVFYDQAFCFNFYDYDKNFKPFKISKREAIKKATGSYPTEELNPLQKIFVKSRLIPFVSNLTERIANRLSGRKKEVNEQEYNVTKEYLNQLNNYVKENNAELIVMVIPAWDDIKEKEFHYLNAVKILKESSIKYVETVDLYSEQDYLKNGGHWKNRGHVIAGHELSKFLAQYITDKQQKSFKKN